MSEKQQKKTNDTKVDSIGLYLKSIGEVPLLTREQEVELAKRVQQGDEEAKKKLTEANLRLVVSIAKRYSFTNVSLMDLVQEGTVGLMIAVNHFDVNRGFKFSTYATWWIRQSILRSIENHSRTIRVPVHLLEQNRKIVNFERQYTTFYGEKPTDEEIADNLHMPLEKVKSIKWAMQDPISLETPIGNGEEDGMLCDFIEDKTVQRPEENAEDVARKQALEQALKNLTERERFVIEERYGLKDGDAKTLETVGASLGVTRERVRQIQAKALRKLKKPQIKKSLTNLL